MLAVVMGCRACHPKLPHPTNNWSPVKTPENSWREPHAAQMQHGDELADTPPW